VVGREPALNVVEGDLRLFFPSQPSRRSFGSNSCLIFAPAKPGKPLLLPAAEEGSVLTNRHVFASK
jgi:hypothetical protein